MLDDRTLLLSFKDGTSFAVHADKLHLFGDDKLLVQSKQMYLYYTTSKEESVAFTEKAKQAGLQVIQFVYDVRNERYILILENQE